MGTFRRNIGYYDLKNGDNVFGFAGDQQQLNMLGLNLYFDGNTTNNRISTSTQLNIGGSFTVLGPGINTYGESGNIGGSNSASYTVGSETITLTDFRYT